MHRHQPINLKKNSATSRDKTLKEGKKYVGIWLKKESEKVGPRVR